MARASRDAGSRSASRVARSAQVRDAPRECGQWCAEIELPFSAPLTRGLIEVDRAFRLRCTRSRPRCAVNTQQFALIRCSAVSGAELACQVGLHRGYRVPARTECVDLHLGDTSDLISRA